MKTKLFLIVGALLILSSCAHTQDISFCVTSNPAGFWNGLWHGFILPFSFIGSLFSENIAIYEVNNNGGFYNLGFMLGIKFSYEFFFEEECK